jgi:hypothetical protein
MPKKNSNNKPLRKSGARISFSKRLPADFFKPFPMYENHLNHSHHVCSNDLAESRNEGIMYQSYHVLDLKFSSRDETNSN